MHQKIKCLFGHHKYDEECDIHLMADDTTGMPARIDWKYTRAGICSVCRKSVRFIDYTLFGSSVFEILEETDDQLTVTLSGLGSIYLRK